MITITDLRAHVLCRKILTLKNIIFLIFWNNFSKTLIFVLISNENM